MAELIPAATAIVLRDGKQGLEVLLLRRSQALAFAAGYWVFPGGRIDAGDYGKRAASEQPDMTLVAKQAAVRESYEEAQLKLCPQQLIPVSQWLAPKETSKRFNTWFFVTRYQGEASVQVDQQEIDHHRWCSPQQALAYFDNKQMAMMPPTYVSLLELAQHQSSEQAIAFYQARGPLRYAAKNWLSTEQDRCMLYAGDAGYEENNAYARGPRHRLWENNGAWIYECDL
ncbi:NUDIX hydrolase [Dasania sp. GY-MA-18]|uniref:NUDIX hydrolase n=1 Tax=Dasania phycosphaerae TaxID=2950436 RepID=A0A9J6RIS8_9GAMM|nr:MULTISPECIES: NUDIX hydrolase [Dasania]MCR8921457.1 NUDIX hydrolase [Dasania sp. GY-MA-18]MCZ0863885.1 NUDIX hydrolase [Dasania phycosphaerae]MCZ0867613.1 NUDIX hydrolase [Dasania phycosphaerae]